MTTPKHAPELTLVIPLYNESEVLPQLLARLDAALPKLGADTEVILVDDGSGDGTAELIDRACRERPWCRGVMLSRNFGHQIAVTAGMQHARGRAVAILDGDLQDPPEVVAEFHAKLKEGYDVVYAVRRQRKEGILKRAAYALFYRLMRALSTIPIPLDSGDFCVMSRRVVDRINAMPERHRFVRGLRSWVGYRQTGHEYPRSARAAGESKYGFSKLLKLAFDGIFTFSEAPLQWSMQFGFLVSAVSFAWGAYIVLWRLFVPGATSLPGWATLTVGMFFLGGVQLFSIGILGEYVGRIHNEVKGRPLFIVERTVNFDDR
ncbi:MAG: glycosyltransferase family 2 protein [Elusimicrobiota bacterium]|nr:glycosyltransferase family 2 protein [Elusimicrobiota bacterium]